eukprot:TRINITY_DN1100_c0_g1_i1.p2 TRINITY_DN1100_c0_g1~~TRINITY_DN1100_c0_g1_i1.p2  ORF type:complete len:166 (-),score=124.22 TRINITY_DN1100_c0_g1_i1:25-522(-)
MAAARRDAFALYDTMLALRRQRAGMMQTRDQLLFCYLTVLDRATPLFTSTDVRRCAWYDATLDATTAAARVRARPGAFVAHPAADGDEARVAITVCVADADADADATADADDAVRTLHASRRPGGFVLDGSSVLYLSLDELAVGEDALQHPIVRDNGDNNGDEKK